MIIYDYILIWLVVEYTPSEQSESWDFSVPSEWKNKKGSKPPTRYFSEISYMYSLHTAIFFGYGYGPPQPKQHVAAC